MIPIEIIKEVLGTLRTIRARTLLALTGIIIGTAAVIAMLHVAYNAKRAALQQFESLGTDQVLFQPMPDGSGGGTLTVSGVLQLPAQNLGIGVAAAITQSFARIQIAGRVSDATILAATDGVYATSKAQIATGRFTSDLDDFAPFATIGSDVAASTGMASGAPAKLGEKIQVNGQSVTVIGILKPMPVSIILGMDLNRSIVIPFKAARRVISRPEITQVAGLVSPNFDARKAADEASSFLKRQLHHGQIQTSTARQLIDNIEAQMKIYSTLIIGIGSVSLIVGGVGIMNVMLMGVIERRQEIGLRLALGARRKDIWLMFLSETIILSTIGSAIGTAIGFVVGRIFAEGSGWTFEAAPLALPLGAGMAFVVGVFFGMYPAARAARLDPVAAMRSE